MQVMRLMTTYEDYVDLLSLFGHFRLEGGILGS